MQNPIPPMPGMIPGMIQGMMPGPMMDRGQLLGPARRASVVMIVFGVMLLLIGGVCGATGALAPPAAVEKGMAEQAAATGQTVDIDAVVVLRLVLGLGIGMTIVGLMMIVLGILARRGTAGIVIFSAIVMGLTTAALAIAVLVLLVGAARNPAALIWVVLLLLPAGMSVMAFVWLIQAVRNTSSIAQVDQYAAYFQQQYQNQLQGMWQQQPGMPPPPQQQQQQQPPMPPR